MRRDRHLSLAKTLFTAALGLSLASLPVAAGNATEDAESAAAFGAPPGGAKVDRECIGASNCRVNVGENAIGYGVFYCVYNGQYVDDVVKGSLSGQPSGNGEAKPKLDPQTVHTRPPSNEYTTITVYTTKKSKPGYYTLRLDGKSQKNKNCKGTYNPAYAPLTVSPKIYQAQGKDVVWWFNGEKPDGYTMELEMTADPPNATSYTWKIKGDYAEFVSGGKETTTSKNTVKLKAKDFGSPQGLPKNKGDFKITVTVNSVESDPKKLRVLRPFSIRFLKLKDSGDVLRGYLSKLHYEMLDQFGKRLPKPVWARENFDFKTVELQCCKSGKETNWVVGEVGDMAGAHPSDPANFADTISGQSIVTNPDRFPLPFGPQAVDDRDHKLKIMRWSGTVTIGSTKKNRGVPVASLVWQKFRDHARHCDLRSPPEDGPQFPCPWGAVK